MQLVGGAAVIFEVAGERDRIGAGLAQGLADIAHLEFGERVGLGLDGGAELHEEAPALGGGQRRARRPRRRRGRRDGRVDVLAVPAAIARTLPRRRARARRDGAIASAGSILAADDVGS